MSALFDCAWPVAHTFALVEYQARGTGLVMLHGALTHEVHLTIGLVTVKAHMSRIFVAQLFFFDDIRTISREEFRRDRRTPIQPCNLPTRSSWPSTGDTCPCRSSLGSRPGPTDQTMIPPNPSVFNQVIFVLKDLSSSKPTLKGE